MCRLADLKSHRLNAELYGGGCPEDLVRSVAGGGVVVPLIVTSDNVVISGYGRWEAAKRAGFQEVAVIERSVASDDDLRLLLLECNTGRRKTIEELIREYREFKRIETSNAAGRRGARTDLRPNPSGSPGGRARELAAARAGDFSATTFETGDKILALLDEKTNTANMQTVETVRRVLNERGVAAAQKALEALQWMNPPACRRKAPAKANRSSLNCGATPIAIRAPVAVPPVLPAESMSMVESQPEDPQNAPTCPRIEDPALTARFIELYREVLGDNPTPEHESKIRESVRVFAASVLGSVILKGEH